MAWWLPETSRRARADRAGPGGLVMGIFGAMTTAVSGLRAQSYALENISGNIANSQTTGYKRLDTSFVDLIPELPYRHELAGSVLGFSRLTNTIQGDLQSTGIPTNIDRKSVV